MATLNIPRDVKDPFYRYKMERLQSKIEGKGNGIKTVVVNLSSVANSLERPPAYLIKYFGFELGAQTNIDPSDDRWIINGAHEASKLQDYLDGFISKFVLCRKCKNPETAVKIAEGDIKLDCKACGQISNVDPRLKLSSFILKQNSTKGKKDKSTKKAERKARKEREVKAAANGGNGENGHNSDGSPDGRNDGLDLVDDPGDGGVDAGSDDELTRRIHEGAQELPEKKEDEDKWATDFSEEAVKARAKQLPETLGRTTLDDDEDGEGADDPNDQLEIWITSAIEKNGGLNNVDNVEIYKKAQELGIEKKSKTLQSLAKSIFDENIVKQIGKRAPMLRKMIRGEKHERALIGGTELLLGTLCKKDSGFMENLCKKDYKPMEEDSKLREEDPKLIEDDSKSKQEDSALMTIVDAILQEYYDRDLVSEEVLKAWNHKALSKRHIVSKEISRKIREAAEQFFKEL